MSKWIVAGVIAGLITGCAISALAANQTTKKVIIEPHLKMCGKDITTPEFVQAFMADPEAVLLAISRGGKVTFVIELAADRFGPGKGIGHCA